MNKAEFIKIFEKTFECLGNDHIESVDFRKTFLEPMGKPKFDFQSFVALIYHFPMFLKEKKISSEVIEVSYFESQKFLVSKNLFLTKSNGGYGFSGSFVQLNLGAKYFNLVPAVYFIYPKENSNFESSYIEVKTRAINRAEAEIFAKIEDDILFEINKLTDIQRKTIFDLIQEEIVFQSVQPELSI